MQPARRRGLAEEAADRIRDEILTGHFEPGDHLREVELAESLQVSRGSVREGLAILVREGLVHSEWHRGTRVVELTETDITEVYAVRAALDRLAALTAAETGRPHQFDELDRLVGEMEREAAGQADGPRLVALDIQFHNCVYAMAGNRRLISAWEAVRSQVHLFQAHRVRLSHEHYRTRVVDEHRELATLLRAGRVEGLGDLAEEHVQSACRGLISSLRG
ncbi:GntR family transcriptional regulator [Amycolatopsis thermophila]|uniref:DNA-binding GntR family transcriptional regulator n=1 Tax=Amycolatopsis thermophila TaxID=206084 RepID=A0ABU0EMB9_9PSEU|nr:GntR family transcriptional regulator [Amycolatopsis thermophila]MDQ0376430.1 DNA-binding GntR family transcriptional regulator [Amycolatopsis thermophila]